MLRGINNKRIIVEREAPLDAINKIKDEINIKVKTFIHGTLCVSYPLKVVPNLGYNSKVMHILIYLYYYKCYN